MWVIILENSEPKETLLFGPYEFEAQAKNDLENSAMIDLILSDTSTDGMFTDAKMCYMNPISFAQQEGYFGQDITPRRSHEPRLGRN